MAQALWTPLAIEELEDILFYISVEAGRPLAGEENYAEIRRLAESYARDGAPRHSHSTAPASWYYFRHKRWLIFYQLHVEGIEVMRVIDASRDLPALIGD